MSTRLYNFHQNKEMIRDYDLSTYAFIASVYLKNSNGVGCFYIQHQKENGRWQLDKPMTQLFEDLVRNEIGEEMFKYYKNHEWMN